MANPHFKNFNKLGGFNYCCNENTLDDMAPANAGEPKLNAGVTFGEIL